MATLELDDEMILGLDEKNDNIMNVNNELYFKKSNYLINMFYKLTSFEHSVLTYIIAGLDESALNADGVISATISVADVRPFSPNDRHIYDKLKRMADKVTKKRVVAIDDASHRFVYYVFIIGASYKDGLFTIQFHPDFRPYLIDLNKNYTMLNLRKLVTCKNIYARTLYESLKSRCYPTKNNPNQTSFIINMKLSELKVEIGYIDMDTPEVEKGIKTLGNKCEFDAIDSFASVTRSTSWGDFKRVVLDPAVKALNESFQEMDVSYDVTRKGYGGKVTNVIFHVTRNDLVQKKEEKEKTPNVQIAEDGQEILFREGWKEDLVLDTLARMKKLRGASGKITKRDAEAVCETANYEKEKIDKAFEVIENKKSLVENITGFMMSSIMKDYNPPVRKKGRKARSTGFTNFQEREYDFDELEKQLIEAQKRTS